MLTSLLKTITKGKDLSERESAIVMGLLKPSIETEFSALWKGRFQTSSWLLFWQP